MKTPQDIIDRILLKYLIEPKFDSGWHERMLRKTHEKPAIKFSIEFFQHDEIPQQVLLVRDKADDEGYLWMTNQRVFFCCSVKDNIFSKPRPYYSQFSYRSLATAEFKKGLIFHKITLRVSTNSADGTLKTITFDPYEKVFAESFVQSLRNRIGKLVEDTSNKTPTQTLKHLKEMLDAGLITQEEYNNKKTEILASM